LDVFKRPDEDVPEIKEFFSPWTIGEPLVRSCAVKEDMNKRGMRRAKKRPMHWGSGSAKAKPEMEDASALLFPFNSDPKKGLFCIFDGHAGKECSTAATQVVPEELLKQLENVTEPDITEVLRNTFLNSDQQLINHEFQGCTATVVCVRQVGNDRYLQAANVGDSTAFLKRGNEVIWLTKDHKASDASERERIQLMGVNLLKGQTRVGGLAVSRALGDHCVKQENVGMIAEPYISPSIKLEPTDSTVILASDGLWDVMTGEEAMSLVENSRNAELMARKLINSALANPKCNDNITVMVVVL